LASFLFDRLLMVIAMVLSVIAVRGIELGYFPWLDCGAVRGRGW